MRRGDTAVLVKVELLSKTCKMTGGKLHRLVAKSLIRDALLLLLLQAILSRLSRGGKVRGDAMLRRAEKKFLG